jgi:hypothetical protein
VAIDNNSWEVHYGAGVGAGSSNIALNLATATSVTFVWDQVTHIMTHALKN